MSVLGIHCANNNTITIRICGFVHNSEPVVLGGLKPCNLVLEEGVRAKVRAYKVMGGCVHNDRRATTTFDNTAKP